MQSKGLSIQSRIRAAALGKSISEIPGKEIGRILNMIFTIMGLRPDQVPDEDQVKILISHMKNDMVRFSNGEFELAFTLYAKSELDFNEAVFGPFSIVFLEKVMQSYARYRFPILNQGKNEVGYDERHPDMAKTKEEFVARAKNDVKQCLHHYIATGEIRDWSGYLYRFLKDSGALSRDADAEAREKYESASPLSVATNEAVWDMLNFTSQEKREAAVRDSVMAEWFDGIVQNGSDINQIMLEL